MRRPSWLKWPWSKRGTSWQRQMETQLAAGKARAEAEFEPPELPVNQKMVVLRRQWRKVYGGNAAAAQMPMWFDYLQERMVPKGLTDREVRLWYFGGLQEAARAFQVILNTSYSKAELRRRLEEAGLETGIEAFDEETQRQIQEGVIKFLPEGEPELTRRAA